jgi:predicted PurR-regulated permease PerM/CheY-like chemotaxis protein
MTKVPAEETVTKATVGPDWQRAIVILTITVVSVVAITILYWGQSIFIPVALGAFLTFLLSPLVSALRQRGVARMPAVFMTVFVAALTLGMVGWVVTAQISGLLRELPKYSENIKAKAKSLKQVAARSNGLTRMFVDINQELGSSPSADKAKGTENGEQPESVPDRLDRVIIEPQSPIWLSRISTFLAPLMEYLGELALAFVLVIFMLQKREELRNRIIRLAGQGRIVTATKFVDEAGQRISRFLLMQAIVNSAFGLTLGLGLLAIGVKYALLWGFLGALLRYLPYIGPYLAAVFPISLSLAMFDGWGTTLMVVGLFLTLELIVANTVEPWLYGQSMGVSEIALLISAAFWAFLWGPVGLVLSSPLTVCLVMLGRYVPQLEFLAVLLGDEPALDTRVSFYQRLLARDQDEAEELIEEHLKCASAEGVYDELLVPTLQAAKISRGRGDITEADEKYVLRAIQEIVEDLGHRPEIASDGNEMLEETATGNDRGTAGAIRVLGYPAHDLEDLTALEMLRNLLDPSHWNLEVLGPETLTAELLDRVAEQRPDLLCLMATPPGGLAHTRYLCKRLRARFPDLKILVCRWARVANHQSTLGHLVEAGADVIAASLLETRQQLASLRPVLAQKQTDREETHRAAGECAPRNGSLSRANERRRASGRDVVETAASS